MAIKAVIMVALCAMLLSAPVIQAQTLSAATIKTLGTQMVSSCGKSVNDKTCQTLLNTGGRFCSSAANTATCTQLFRTICTKKTLALCTKLGPVFCNKTGSQKANCLKLGQQLLRSLQG